MAASVSTGKVAQKLVREAPYEERISKLERIVEILEQAVQQLHREGANNVNRLTVQERVIEDLTQRVRGYEEEIARQRVSQRDIGKKMIRISDSVGWLAAAVVVTAVGVAVTIVASSITPLVAMGATAITATPLLIQSYRVS